MHFIDGLVREPAVLAATLLFGLALGLLVVDAFSRTSDALTRSAGRRNTIVMRCLEGEAPLWVVYWLFGIVGGALAGLVAVVAAIASPIFGIALLAIYAGWWLVSFLSCVKIPSFGVCRI